MALVRRPSAAAYSTESPSSTDSPSETTPTNESASNSHTETLAQLARPGSQPDGGADSDGSVAADDPEHRRRRNTKTLIDSLVTRLRVRGYGALLRGADAAQQVEELNGYLDGFVDTVGMLAQDHHPELRHEVEEALCNGQTDVELMLFARISQRIPEIASQRGLDCVLSQHQEEDAVLTEALDAYRAGRYPPSAAWLSWQTKARADVVRRRLTTLDSPTNNERRIP